MGTNIYCQHCGTEIESDTQICPKCSEYCGPGKRRYEEKLTASIRLSTSMGVEIRDASGFKKISEHTKNKRAGKTGRKARESLSIDRTDKQVTIKKHIVEEQNEEGKWETVHNEEKKFPAKHRPHGQQIEKKEDS